MRYLFLFLFLSLITPKVRSQYVGLNDKEIYNLKKLIGDNSDAHKYFTSFKKIADEALNQMPDPIDTIVSEGHLANDPKKIITGRSLKDIDKIYSLAITYSIGNDTAYLN